MFIWIFVGVGYVMCWICFGMATFGQGYDVLLWADFIFPVLWITGALLSTRTGHRQSRGPTPHRRHLTTLEGS